MIGKITSVKNGPERNVKIIITPTELYSQISSPLGNYLPDSVDHYEIMGLQTGFIGIITLTFVLKDGHRVLFYSTKTQFDMVLLLDQLDGTIGERHREAISN